MATSPIGSPGSNGRHARADLPDAWDPPDAPAHREVAHGRHDTRVLVVGAGDAGEMIVREMRIGDS